MLERDLLRPDALADLADDYTHVIHLAAILGVQNVLEQPYATLRDNVHLLEAALALAARQSRLERLVFASTSEVYAGSLELMDMPIPTPESTPLALPRLEQPRTSYMLSKIYGEAMVRHSGLPFTQIPVRANGLVELSGGHQLPGTLRLPGRVGRLREDRAGEERDHDESDPHFRTAPPGRGSPRREPANPSRARTAPPPPSTETHASVCALPV